VRHFVAPLCFTTDPIDLLKRPIPLLLEVFQEKKHRIDVVRLGLVRHEAESLHDQTPSHS